MKYVIISGLQAGQWVELTRLHGDENLTDAEILAECEKITDALREGQKLKMSNIFNGQLNYVNFADFSALRFTISDR